MEHVLRCSAVAAMGLATAALMLAMQKAFPAVRLVPCAPIAGEAMHLWAYRPMPAEEPLTIQDRIGAMEHTVQEKYGVQTVVVALPEPVPCASHGSKSGGTATTPSNEARGVVPHALAMSKRLNP